MTISTGNRQAHMTAIVNGVLVFGVPAGLTVVALMDASGRPWSDQIEIHRPPTSRLVTESVQCGLVYAALAVVAWWRTWVHAQRYLSGASRGWQGVGEAAVVGFSVAVLYLAQGIVTRPSEAPPYVIVYGSAAAILGAIVGVVLRMTAMMVLRLTKSGAA